LAFRIVEQRWSGIEGQNLFANIREKKPLIFNCALKLEWSKEGRSLPNKNCVWEMRGMKTGGRDSAHRVKSLATKNGGHSFCSKQSSSLKRMINCANTDYLKNIRK
jgi:hypothetical protein